LAQGAQLALGRLRLLLRGGQHALVGVAQRLPAGGALARLAQRLELLHARTLLLESRLQGAACGVEVGALLAPRLQGSLQFGVGLGALGLTRLQVGFGVLRLLRLRVAFGGFCLQALELLAHSLQARLDTGALGGLAGDLAQRVQLAAERVGARALGLQRIELLLLLLERVAFGMQVHASLGEGVQPRLQLGALLRRLRELLHRVQFARELTIPLGVGLDGFVAVARRLELLPLGAQLLDASLGVLTVVLKQGALVLHALILLAQGGLRVVVGACGVARGDGSLQRGLLRLQRGLRRLQGLLNGVQLRFQRARVADALSETLHRRLQLALRPADGFHRLADALVAQHAANLLAPFLGRVAEKLQLLLAGAEAGLELQVVHAQQLLQLAVDPACAARQREPTVVGGPLRQLRISGGAPHAVATVAQLELQLHAHLRAALRPQKAQRVRALPQRARPVQRPQYRLQQRGLARAVRADNRRDARLKSHLRVGVLAKVLQLQRD
jgi:hypothetical protein